ncbi:RsmB/NOP family class I SAM-dependent RNA methyltransferase [Shewanella maritima]|uniref:RsmB/NOP family class I SAM-dependent RNA methyltransferase n=1 Tax=Shewanella maritima TaxID=2520507 RepID=A0A411PKG9_9GAMM|nr:RsmB/NOP family class I SAM-dependent RNA methyltransferase [Shewanella maritima]QBF84018.1 RsmB/NOP family class I SAM-dependent RNA methyltransferase [Shewanella maritima]
MIIAPNHSMPLAISELNIDEPSQRRALSYANTIHMLFDKVMTDKQPADRIVADYFREHKKHGSKDRKVIRETLFATFRWWGWLKQLGDYQQASNWLAMIALASKIEAKQFAGAASTWQQLSSLDINWQLDAPTLGDFVSVDELKQLTAYVNQAVGININASDLAPTWFWQHCFANKQADASSDANADSALNSEVTQQQLSLAAALSSRPPIWGRAQNVSAQTLVTELVKEQIDAQLSENINDAINLGHKNINLPALNAFKQGRLEIQDLGSQVIGYVCAVKDDEHWWDTCSGAGGKTLQLRSQMLMQNAHSSGSIVSSDIRKKPLQELQKRAKRAGFSGITTAPWQDESLPVDAISFDGVLVDAPCSCTGTWRRNPDMRWIDDESAINNKPELQLDILTRSAEAVKVGGKLVYATCSLAIAENQGVVEAFAKANTHFELQTLRHPFTDEQTQMLTVMPEQANSDGMFAAVFIRKS